MITLQDSIIKFAFAIVCGAILGIEREYKSKPAGFRTMILITIGSCLFTMLSTQFSTNQDRIASNIVTGIGFIGAGVVFKEGLHITGITSAATIWLAAALGMSIGLGFYWLALLFCLLVFLILWALKFVEKKLDDIQSTKLYQISCNQPHYINDLNMFLHEQAIKHTIVKTIKQADIITIYCEVIGSKNIHKAVYDYVFTHQHFTSVEV